MQPASAGGADVRPPLFHPWAHYCSARAVDRHAFAVRHAQVGPEAEERFWTIRTPPQTFVSARPEVAL